MSIPGDSRERKHARGYAAVRVIRIILLVAIGVGGYVAYRLGPGWFRILYSREMASLRGQAATLFVDILLIAYPLALLVSISGTIVLTYWRLRARSLCADRTRRQRVEIPCRRDCCCFLLRSC